MEVALRPHEIWEESMYPVEGGVCTLVWTVRHVPVQLAMYEILYIQCSVLFEVTRQI